MKMPVVTFSNGMLEGFTMKINVSEHDSKSYVCYLAVRQVVTLLEQLNFVYLSKKVRNSNFCVLESIDGNEESVYTVEEVTT
jgi:hypothetical protein